MDQLVMVHGHDYTEVVFDGNVGAFKTTPAGTMRDSTVMCAGDCRTAWSSPVTPEEFHVKVIDKGWREIPQVGWMCPDCMRKMITYLHHVIGDTPHTLDGIYQWSVRSKRDNAKEME